MEEDYATDTKAKFCIAKPSKASEETETFPRESDCQKTIGCLQC